MDSLRAVRACCAELPRGDDASAAAAAARQDGLTKPRGSLGRLEELVAWLARWQGRERPRLELVGVLVFAGNHGVAARGVSPFPAAVTAQMVANFAAGGAAINQIARVAGATLRVVTLRDLEPTADLSRGPAMLEHELLDAIRLGADAVNPELDLLCLGEMGIANTTSAAALAAATFGGTGADWAGRGTGLDDRGVRHKAAVIDEALARHGDALGDPLEALRRVGGLELAAMFGACLAARLHGVPVLLDGFVCTASVAPLARLAPDGLAHARAAHCSAEAAHRTLLRRLDLRPLLDFDMRLGEASGAALAVPLLRAACACHDGMASFAEAGVSDREPAST
ncbi:nicotinate-nucleotide--dimethylbenzimidazole phosphoribosyltransferase [Rhizosaccharibacter radicis]|uniref:Nicotinate-nucleotide--dimethylbenzimidazole phosphoribosyltransferase n=1 Tax=Rhizosaccharibacter radicis TaxID=2782605 RepID=A0ABT1VY87_9PROT|nr:nicotinate-nucleotide--dimethylbenzimidazole phosphoribosyltransferase [Acetobacteraceae bacterium KSS12]